MDGDVPSVPIRYPWSTILESCQIDGGACAWHSHAVSCAWLVFRGQIRNARSMMPNRRTFLKQLGYGAAGLGVFSLLPACRTLPRPASALPRSTPEAQGISSAGILAFLDAASRTSYEWHSFMLVRHGQVVAEGWWSPYGPGVNHTMYSMSKSFTSTAIGFAVAEGKLRVDDRVVSFFPNDLPEKVSDHLAALRIKDLLTMSVGNEKEPTQGMIKEANWVRTFLASPISDRPGTKFMYNSAATYMCSAIVQQVTGQRMLDYLTPRLFQPLGIDGPTWERCPRGIDIGGWGLGIQTEGLAKFGQLYLQKGVWRGQRLLPVSWIEEATSFKIQQPVSEAAAQSKDKNDWLQGYCYQFWRCRHNAVRGDGAFGQFTIMMPDQDAVLAITSESNNMQEQLNLVWEHLLPAMHDQPLAPAQVKQTQLQQRLANLAFVPPKARPSSAWASRVSGKTFRLEPNALGLQSASFQFHETDCLVDFRDAQTVYPITCGIERWRPGETALPGTPPRLVSGGAPKPGTEAKLVASGTWRHEDTFDMMFRYYETPHHDSVACRFEGDTLEVTFLSSLAKMNPQPKDSRPVLRGRSAPANA